MHHPSVLEGFVQKQRIPVHICARFFYCFLRERTHTYLILILLFLFACKDMIDALCRCRVDKQFPNSVMQAAARLPIPVVYTHSHLRCALLTYGTLRWNGTLSAYVRSYSCSSWTRRSMLRYVLLNPNLGSIGFGSPCYDDFFLLGAARYTSKEPDRRAGPACSAASAQPLHD